VNHERHIHWKPVASTAADDTAIEAGAYQPECGHDMQRLRAGQRFPACPVCYLRVPWTLVRVE
jgi:hypothetical protein